ncbi:MAG: alpha/beta hydrolase [Alphaproteobacteria bacterium]|nr:alpha/beta hydrolase [Alphaproteobacteria bacterium]
MRFFFAIIALLLTFPAHAEVKAYDAMLDGYTYPFHVRHFSFESQRQPLKMAYMRIRGDDAKPTVLLLHGKNFGGAYWGDTAMQLSQKGYNVVIPDQIGFGKSSKPAHYQFSFPQLVNNTTALLDELQVGKVIVVGHSMGGMLATRFALMHPERTAKLILINPIGLEDYLSHVAYRDAQDWYASELKQTPEAIVEYQKKYYYDNQWKPEYEQWTLPLQGWLLGKDKERVAWNAALTYDMIFSEPVVQDFPLLKVPTRLIIGTRDRTAPGQAFQKDRDTYEMGRYDRLGDEAAKQIPNAKLRTLDGLGHVPQLENFDAFWPVFEAFLTD